MAKVVTDLYNNVLDARIWYANGILEMHRSKENEVFHKWNECFNEFVGKQSNSNTAQICNFGTVRYLDYIQALNRKIVCIDDIRSVLTNKHKFRVIYTDNDTWLSRDPSFEPEETIEAAGLFQGL